MGKENVGLYRDDGLGAINSCSGPVLDRIRKNIISLFKHYLNSIISTVPGKSGVNQWRNTAIVIDWFKNLPNKSKRRFVKFDVADFYPLITKDLLEKSIEYAKSFTTIKSKALESIQLARKSLLFSKDGPWLNKDNSLFDVTMGSFEGDEICEVVGLYLLSKFVVLLGKENIGLYRDDSLVAINSCSGLVLDRTRINIMSV